MSDTAIHRAVTILDALAQHPQGLRFGQAKELLGGISPTTVSRILKILCETGVVQQSQTGYVFTDKVQSWAASSSEELDLRALCIPEMRRLTQVLQTSSILWKRDGNEMLTLHKELDPNAPSLMVVGASFPIAFHLIGAVFFLSEHWDAPKELLQQAQNGLPNMASIDLPLIERMIATARRDDYMDDECAFYPGNYRVAVPLRKNGKAIASIGLAIMKHRMEDNDFRRQVFQEMKLSQQKIESILAHF